jgi:hypothetical protein
VLQRGGCVIYAILVLAASVPLVRGQNRDAVNSPF